MTFVCLPMVHGVCIPPRTLPRFPTRLNQQLGSQKPLQSVARQKERPIGLAEVPVLEDETHWRSVLDVRDTDLDQKMALMNDMYHGASGHEDIVSIRTGWSDEHIHADS